MTPLELQALIASDTEAASLLAQGDDTACAARCSAIAPKVRKEAFLTERGMYFALGATVAETILQKLVTFAQAEQASSPIVARVLEWLKPNNGGVDFGLQQTVEFVAMLHQAEVLTVDEYNAINALSLYPQIITPIEVEYVRTRI